MAKQRDFYGYAWLGALVALVSAAGLSPSRAEAGGMEGGGGKGVLCGTRLRTLDLYEAEEVHGLKLSRAFPDLWSNIEHYVSRLSRLRSVNDVKGWYESSPGIAFHLYGSYILDRFKDVPSGTLPLTDDATLPPLKEGCRVVQILIFPDDKDAIPVSGGEKPPILRDPGYWYRLDPLNQAALVLHELLNHEARGLGARTSDDVRKFIGELFSETPGEPKFAPLWDAERMLECHTWTGVSGPESLSITPGPATSFFIIDETRDGTEGVGVYFHVIEGQLQLRRTSAFIPVSSLEALYLGGSWVEPEFKATNHSTGKNWRLGLEADDTRETPSVGFSYMRLRSFDGRPDEETTPVMCQLQEGGGHRVYGKPKVVPMPKADERR